MTVSHIVQEELIDAQAVNDVLSVKLLGDNPPSKELFKNKENRLMIEMNNGESSANRIIKLYKESKFPSRIEDYAYLIHENVALKSTYE